MQDEPRRKLEFFFGGCLLIITVSLITFAVAADALIALITYICGAGWQGDLW